jgi:hypothetical protein
MLEARCALGVVIGVLALVAGSSAAAEPVVPAETAAVVGQLLHVDLEARTIVVRASDGADWQFTYDEHTQVAGAREGVAGLAAEPDAQVTVTYTERSQTKVATRIEVHPRR